MPRGKTPPSDVEPKKKISNSDIASFLSELEDDPTPESAVETTAPVDKTEMDDEETADDQPGKKITVRSEREVVRRPRISENDDVLPEPSKKRTPPPEMQQLTKSKSLGIPWGWIVTILLVLVAVSVAGFFVFTRAKKFTGNNVQLHFQPVTNVASGANVTITIEYQNLEPVDLTKGELAVEYPEGFSYISSQPATTNEFHNDFTLGTIRSGQAGKVTITGTLIGSVGTTRDFRATMTYRPVTFNSDFQQQAATTITIASSILNVSIAGPTQLAPGVSGTWTINYTNTSDRDLQNVQFEATYPEGFTVTKTVPAAKERSGLWRVDKISKGATGNISFTGAASGSVGDSLPVIIKTGLLNSDGNVEAQDEQQLLLILVKTGVTATIAVNGSTVPLSIDPGESLNYSIHVTNSSDAEVANATITMTLTGAALKADSVTSDTKGVVNERTVTWSKDQVPALAQLKPQQDVTLTASVGTQTNLTIAADQDRNQQVVATVAVTSPSLSTNTNSTSNPSVVSTTKINTILGLTAVARYYNDIGQALGSGPVPPVVGKTTTYHVNWTVTNTTNDASTLVVSATLPNGVLWTGQNTSRDAGDIAFDSASRTVRWTLNIVPAGTGSRYPSLKAGFDVSITPTADQVGTVPILVNTATAAAKDAFTDHELSVTAPAVATDIPTDTKAGGEGRVIAE
ncbi:MAG: hypothetical protein HY975_03715 [Candidatus Kerfeldbacteria bacterium]|nr:hypothetical protein [Candidatus Kerfeldbacteria bacterium]